MGALGCVVVLVTAIALTLPALSMTHDKLVCGYDEEHVHTQECYSTVLSCGKEENESHHHTEACYEQVLTCGRIEHTHTDACYERASDQQERAEDVVVAGVETTQADDAESSDSATETAALDDVASETTEGDSEATTAADPAPPIARTALAPARHRPCPRKPSRAP